MWIETQVARNHYASPEDYVVELVEKERARRERLKTLRRLMADARAAPMSQRSPEAILADGRPNASGSALARLRAQVREGRESGRSRLGPDAILAEALGLPTPGARAAA